MGVGFEHNGLGTELRLGEGPGEEVEEDEKEEEEEEEEEVSDVSIRATKQLGSEQLCSEDKTCPCTHLQA